MLSQKGPASLNDRLSDSIQTSAQTPLNNNATAEFTGDTLRSDVSQSDFSDSTSEEIPTLEEVNPFIVVKGPSAWLKRTIEQEYSNQKPKSLPKTISGSRVKAYLAILKKANNEYVKRKLANELESPPYQNAANAYYAFRVLNALADLGVFENETYLSGGVVKFPPKKD